MKKTFNYAVAAISMILLIGNAGIGHASPSDNQAEAVLAMAKASSGGAAWDAITSIRLEGVVEAGGQQGSFTLKATLMPAPRESVSLRLGTMRMGFGWDGKQGWDLAPSGVATVQSVPKEIAERRTAVYSDLIGYFRPGRLGASLHYVGKRQADATDYQIVRIEPLGGAPFELWINDKNHRIERQVAITSEPLQMQLFADFRTVGGVTVPFLTHTLVVNADGKTAERDRSSLTRYDINPPLSEADVAMPSSKANTASGTVSAQQ